jgi:hypothetical protein
MSELIYANVDDNYGYIYNNKGSTAVRLSEKFPENDAVVFRMNYDELQLCKIGRHRIGRPSQFFQYYYEKVDRDFFRDSLSSVFELEFVDEKYFKSLATGTAIGECRRQGDVDSLRSIGSYVMPRNSMSSQTLTEILGAVLAMIDAPGAGHVDIGIPYARFDKDMRYDDYAEFCANFGVLWRETLTDLYARLPYLLRRRIGFTVNASAGYSNKEIRVVSIDRSESAGVCLLNPPRETDPDCMRFAAYLVGAQNADELFRRLETLKGSVEDYFRDGAIDRIPVSAYVRFIDEFETFRSMDKISLFDELYDESAKEGRDEAYLVRLANYIGQNLTEQDADEYFRVLLDENFTDYIHYLTFLTYCIRKAFPEYRIPYNIILSSVDGYATDKVFAAGSSMEQVKAEYDNLLSMIDREAAEKDSLSVYQCACGMLKGRYDAYEAGQSEALKEAGLRSLSEGSVPWDRLEEWLGSFGGSQAQPEIISLKSGRILDELPSMTIGCDEAAEIVARCEGCLTKEAAAVIGNIMRFAMAKGVDIVADLMAFDGRSGQLGIEKEGPAEFVVQVLSSRYTMADLCECFNRKYNEEGIDDLFNLELSNDYDIKKVYARSVVAIMRQSDGILLRLPRFSMSKYRLLVRNVCSVDESLMDLPAELQLDIGTRTESVKFDHFAQVLDVFDFAMEETLYKPDPEIVRLLLDESKKGFLSYMIDSRIVTGRHFGELSKQDSCIGNGNLRRVFIVLSCNQYEENLTYETLKNTVGRERITSEEVSRLFPARGAFTPCEPLVTLAAEQSRQSRKRPASRLNAEDDGGETDPHPENAFSDPVNMEGAYQPYTDPNLMPGSNIGAVSRGKKSSLDVFDFIVFGVCGLLLLFGIVGVVFALLNRSTAWLFWVLAVISSLAMGGSVALLVNKLFGSSVSYQDPKGKSQTQLLSIISGVVTAFIVCAVLMLIGTGGAAKKPSSSQNQTQSQTLARPATGKMKEGWYTLQSPDGRYLGLGEVDQEGRIAVTMVDTPRAFYIKRSSQDNIFLLFTDTNEGKLVSLYGTDSAGLVFHETVNTGESKSVLFSFEESDKGGYFINFAYNGEALSIDSEGNVITQKPDANDKTVWNIVSAEAPAEQTVTTTTKAPESSDKENEYQPTIPSHTFVGKCTISVTNDKGTYYLTRSKSTNKKYKNMAVLTDNKEDAILYMEKEGNNRYFVILDGQGSHYSLCYAGNELKNGVRIKFSILTEENPPESYQWNLKDSENVFYANDPGYYISYDAKNGITLQQAKEGEIIPGHWKITMEP